MKVELSSQVAKKKVQMGYASATPEMDSCTCTESEGHKCYVYLKKPLAEQSKAEIQAFVNKQIK